MASNDGKMAAEIDQTPLSPVERKDSLEKHLQMRPEEQDLKNRVSIRDCAF